MIRPRVFTAFPMGPKTLTSAVPDMTFVPFASHPVRERLADHVAPAAHRHGMMRSSASWKKQIEAAERLFVEVLSSP